MSDVITEKDLDDIKAMAWDNEVKLGRRIKELESRLGSATEQNRSLRAWIRELRDTQEERGQVPADPLYSMLMERIDPLVQADPAPDSADGIRLVVLAELCEAYEGVWVSERRGHKS